MERPQVKDSVVECLWCEDSREVCAAHPERPWGGLFACPCRTGPMTCPLCAALDSSIQLKPKPTLERLCRRMHDGLQRVIESYHEDRSLFRSFAVVFTLNVKTFERHLWTRAEKPH